jgi:response regulator RpfG family c-di-GMP phosphodiesterase/serine/threonine protein kinase
MMKNDYPSMSHTVILPGLTGTTTDQAPAQRFIDSLLEQNILLMEDWEALPPRAQRRVLEAQEHAKALEQLVKHGLLTRYQAGRVEAGTTFGLVLGSYRLTERLGAGGMAVVFKAEHTDLRHHVAVKVLPPTTREDSAIESRFFAEMRIIARLRHPNIVAATDAGRVVSEDDHTILRYLVMEYVPGQDLEDVIRRHGLMSPARACSIAYQMASALSETHKYGLVHRDIKPSNMMLTGEDQVKLLDFGLTRHFGHRMTVPGTILGTIDYMAPEQARDASTVDIRADIFGLGGTLYWCLTGQVPFPFTGNPVEALTRRLTAPAPSAREANPDIPPELDAIVSRMMAMRPEDRYPDPTAVMQALLPFVRAGSGDYESLSALPLAESIQIVPLPDVAQRATKYRILVIDDEGSVRELCKQLLEAEGAIVDLAGGGSQGLTLVAKGDYDLVLLDVAMPDMNGVEVLARIRQQQPKSHIKVLMFSGHTTPEEMSEMLSRGADDFLTKPFSIAQLLARVQNLLRLKTAQDQAALFNRKLLAANAELEGDLQNQGGDAGTVRNAIVLAMARLIEQREGRGTGHPVRMQKYCRILAEASANHSHFASEIDCAFVDLLESSAPLHDIGRVGLPDHVLMKVGPLTAEERLTMETHTVIAADALREVVPPDGAAGEQFLKVAMEVTRHHHERHDGTGYPDRLAGDAIPLSARLVAVADVYDALRCRRLYKPALPHAAAIQIITQNSPGQFDPAILDVFKQVAARFDAIFRETPD